MNENGTMRGKNGGCAFLGTTKVADERNADIGINSSHFHFARGG
jgi:hypothetical protein